MLRPNDGLRGTRFQRAPCLGVMSTEDMNFLCPVCAWPELEFDPLNSACEFCPCCGVEFGCDDIPESSKVNIRTVDSVGNISSEQTVENVCKYSTREGMWVWLREHWISTGMKWSFGVPPNEWNPNIQLETLNANET